MPSQRNHRRFKLLLDEGLPRKESFPNLNNLHTIRHINHDLKKSGSNNTDVYKLVNEKDFDLVVVFNTKDYLPLLEKDKASIISLSTNLTNKQIDLKLCKLLREIHRFFDDPNSVDDINNVRDFLRRGVLSGANSYSPGLLLKIANRYESTVGNKANIGGERLLQLLDFIKENGGKFALSEVARNCGISQSSARQLLSPHILSGRVIRVMRSDDLGRRNGKKQYLSIAD